MSREELFKIVGPKGIDAYRMFLTMYKDRPDKFINECEESVDLMTSASLISAVNDEKVTVVMSKEQASVSAFLMLNGWSLIRAFVDGKGSGS